MAARAANVGRVVMSRRVDDPPGAGPIRRLKYGAWCDHIVAISEGIRRVLLDWGVPPQKVSCVRSAIDLTPYLGDADPTAFRRRFGIPEDALMVATLAQLIPRKGHRVLLEVIPRILEQVPNARFLFFGEGPYRSTLESLVERKGLTGIVQLPGYVTETPALLRAADAIVHPALREGLGIAILEAMGMGKPVVASAVGGIPEVIDGPETGFLVPPGDSSALEDALVRLLRDSDLRRRIGDAAARRIRDEFSIDAMVAGNLDIYTRLLHTR
jgi:glycosyltransferase involved in cell wall biosynthesis